jgi:hypothetical protein
MPKAEIRFVIEGLPADSSACAQMLDIIARVLGARFEAVAVEHERAIFVVALDPTRSDFHELRDLVSELGRRLGYQLLANLMSP